METRDVIDPATPASEPRSRAETLPPLIDPNLWQPLAKRLNILIGPFSSAQTPPEEGTDINAALQSLLEQQPNLAAVLLLSDGDWNTGTPPAQAATRLRMRDTPLFTVPIGSDTKLPDLELTAFDVPTFAIAGKPLRIPFTITSSLPRDETLTVELKTPGGEIISKTLTLPAMATHQDSIAWRPADPGETTLTLTLPKTGAERYLENNTLSAPLTIRKEQLRVLLVETYPRWEYRYLRNALDRDPGIDVHCLLLHPGLGKPATGNGYLPAFPKDDQLAQYDVIFLGDIGLTPGQLTQENVVALQKLIRDQATGLVFLPGIHGHQLTLANTPLADLLPIQWDETQPRGWGSTTPGKIVLTETGAQSLLTKLGDTDELSTSVWATLPGFQWHAPALRAKAGSEVLATHGSESNRFGRIPLIVTKTYGAGKILYMGADGAWRWRRGVEDRHHYRFWGQVVRWMAYQRNMAGGDRIRLFYTPDRPKTGDTLTLNANVMTLSGEPQRDGAVIAQIATPTGKTSSIRLTPAGDEAWGLFTATFTPTEPGEHQINLTSPSANASLETKLSVQGSTREKLGQPIKKELLRELAQITRGQLLETTDPTALLATLTNLPEPQPTERRIPLWAHPVWAGILLTLMALFWIGRKATGAF
ncbi:hypothetical protein FEM03_09680 [Phragmitibacter flavus]|uniref:Glutamine amidotransferase domain-containing protein n=2 Tax=Phragmitibacter flavus TaxID=2576071 RepID=A0A5R8KFZ2_9BACT|nr:hypothetical protein FEM03_09680 [Phragmitibacter flavus]